jgi:hypothetical protein
VARLNLSSFDGELIARGFSGFAPEDRYRYINWGYYHVARASRWYWEKTDIDFTVAVGASTFTLPDTFKTLEALMVVTADHRVKLNPTTEQDFLINWLPLDLSSTANQGEPGTYYVWGSTLYVLPPPNASRDFTAYIYQRVAELEDGPDKPITPPDHDEAILLGALIRCHTRANQPELAREARMQLEEQFDIALTEDNWRNQEEQERVEPDTSWQW